MSSAAKRIQKELQNAQRKKRRLKDKARQLTTADLLEVLLMRKSEQNEPSSQESTKTGDDEDLTDKVPDEDEPEGDE